jgi:tetratricopeptide (TPR) repeat protein
MLHRQGAGVGGGPTKLVRANTAAGPAHARLVLCTAILCAAMTCCLSVVQTLGQSSEQNSGKSGAAFERGIVAFRAGNYSASAAQFAQAEAASPGSTDALVYEAKSLVHLQDFAAAEKALRRYLVSGHDSPDALYMLGFVLNRQNRPAESLESYTQAAALAPPTGDDLKIVGLNYVLLDDYPDAIKWLEKAVEFDAKNKDAWYYLGRAYYTKARLAEARKAFLAVLNLDPREVRAENNLGLIFESDAKPADAMKAFQNAIVWQEHTPHPSEQPYVNLGNLLIEDGRAKDAIDPLEKAAKLAPGNAYCRLRLGTAYMRTGDLDKAQRELEEATQLDPESAVAHYQLGRLYKQIHAMDRAKAEFERTAELETRSASSAKTTPSH